MVGVPNGRSAYMKTIPTVGGKAERMAAMLGDEIRLAWKPKGTSWLGVTPNFRTGQFAPQRLKSRDAAAAFVHRMQRKPRPRPTLDDAALD